MKRLAARAVRLLENRLMRTLFHMPLDPASRAIRIVLAEKGLPARLVETPPWESHPDLIHHNPANTIPVLIDDAPTGGEIAISPVGAIIEYLEEAYGGTALLPATSAARAEARRLVDWFNVKFEHEVNAGLLRKRVDERLQGRRADDFLTLQETAAALGWHLDYCSFLLEQRGFLAGERLGLADIVGAAHLSANDYLGVVPWKDFPLVRNWYQTIKSRPSMRPLLADRVPFLPPPAHYDDLDF